MYTAFLNFRLPKEIVFSEVNFLERLGVKLNCNTVVGRTVELDELFEAGFRCYFPWRWRRTPQIP